MTAGERLQMLPGAWNQDEAVRLNHELALAVQETAGNALMKQHAIAMQRRMASDNGPETAATLIEQAMSDFAPRASAGQRWRTS